MDAQDHAARGVYASDVAVLIGDHETICGGFKTVSSSAYVSLIVSFCACISSVKRAACSRESMCARAALATESKASSWLDWSAVRGFGHADFDDADDFSGGDQGNTKANREHQSCPANS